MQEPNVLIISVFIKFVHRNHIFGIVVVDFKQPLPGYVITIYEMDDVGILDIIWSVDDFLFFALFNRQRKEFFVEYGKQIFI